MFNWKGHTDPRTTSLRRIDLFAGLAPRQLEQIAKLTTHLRVGAGKTLCEEGRPGDSFFIIECGEVQLSNGVRLGSGDFFGEMALVTKRTRSATAVVVDDADVLVLSPREFASVRGVDDRVGARLDEAIRARTTHDPAD